LVWYTPELELRPHVAEAWEVNEDATEWTWHLRKGMKWSDGYPFTSEAFTWFYESQLLNEELTPGPPGDWSTGSPRVLMDLEVPDDYTVVTKFAHPNPLVANKWNRPAPFEPGHYLKQFHIEETEDKAGLEKAIQDAGFSSWVEYFADREYWYLNPDKPGVGAWVAKNPLSEELFVMERNPYFFGVDPDGNQLPYIDQITHRLFSTPDVFNLWIVNGEIDFQARHVSMGNYTLFKENEEQGDYWVALAITPMHVSLFPNQTCPDPRIREFNQNRDVRIAVSLAINRDEINELVWDGLFTPRQYSPLEEAPEYYPKAANAYIEYDTEKANELLDAAGYDQRDSEGFRLWKDGSDQTISIVMEGTSVPGDPMEDAAQMVVKYLEDVGLKISYKAVERSLYEEHWSSNNIEWAWWTSDYTMLPLIMPHTWLATMLDNPWAVGWGQYLLDPSSPIAEEPPEGHWIWDIWDIWANEVAVEIDAKKRIELFQKILDIFAEEMPMPTVVGEAPGPCIVKNGLRNYVEGYPDVGRLGNENFLGTETYFWEEPEKHS
jgi:peptide/nickel transport system substrate-binding protein